MYGGLFGDLPAAKNSKEKDDQPPSSSQSTSRNSERHLSAADHQPAVPTANVRVAVAPSEKAAILKHVGASGTSVAFVPTATLRRGGPKRPPPSDATRIRPRKPPSVPTGVGSSDSQTPDASETRNQPSSASTNDVTSLKPAILKETVVKTSSRRTDAIRVTESIPHIVGDAADEDSYDEEERQRQRLHERVEDAYDPLVPNDLQQYLEVRALQEERERMERQRQLAIEQQERLRHELQQQRQESIRSTGNDGQQMYGSQEPLAAGRGSGRGGLSNLPAWMQKKQM
jgi:hypothetical protein